MKRISAFMLLAIAFSSCQKKDAVTPQPTSPKVSKMTATATSYDYTQPMSKIFADATVNSSDRVKAVFANSTYHIDIIVGRYIGDDPVTGESICFVGGVCEVIFTGFQKSQSQLYSGSVEEPIGVIQAIPTGPVAKLATEVSYNVTEDGYTHVKNAFTE